MYIHPIAIAIMGVGAGKLIPHWSLLEPLAKAKLPGIKEPSLHDTDALLWYIQVA